MYEMKNAAARQLTVEKEIELQMLEREICHTVIHRMSFCQLLLRSRFWRKRYNECCERLIKLETSQKRCDDKSTDS